MRPQLITLSHFSRVVQFLTLSCEIKKAAQVGEQLS
jgi:hypothetical protein